MWARPELAPLLTLVVTALALGLTVLLARRAPVQRALAAGVTLSVILFPMAQEYHYTLLVLPLAVAATQVWRTRRGVILFGSAVCLLYLPFKWNAPLFSAPGFALFAYPRLYGGLLLWLWCLLPTLSRVERRAASPSAVTP